MKKNHKVFIVEDEPDIRALLIEIFDSEGFIVNAYSNGAAAFEALKSARHPDLIILDWMMPVMDGFDFIAELSRRPRLKTIPIILVSAAPSEDVVNAKVQLVIKKPFNISALVGAARSILAA